MAWTERPVLDGESAPVARDAQAHDVTADGSKLIMVCGDPLIEDRVDDYVCDVWQLDLATGEWQELTSADL